MTRSHDPLEAIRTATTFLPERNAPSYSKAVGREILNSEWGAAYPENMARARAAAARIFPTPATFERFTKSGLADDPDVAMGLASVEFHTGEIE